MTIHIHKNATGQRLLNTSLLAAAMIGLSACSSDSDSTSDDNLSNADLIGQYAYVAGRAEDYSSGRIDRLSLAEGNILVGSYPATESDIGVDTDGVRPYQTGRYGIDSITRFDAEDTSIVDYQFSVIGDEPLSANPIDLAFSGENRAYLTRRNSETLWIIDPAAEAEEDFKLEEIDLSAYNTDLPYMTDAIIVDDKLFVLVERLQLLDSGFQVPDKKGYLAVFNTITNTEIETGQGADGLLGIELDITNPSSLQYNADTGLIYVVGRGNYFENAAITDDFHSGGVQVIDPTSYTHELVLDDGTDEDNDGYFFEMEVINADLGYLLTYSSYQVSTLRTFNPTTGELSAEVLPELDGVDITTIAQGPDNHLWVGINDSTPGFYRVDLATGELAQERVATTLVPMEVVFIDVPQGTD